MSSKSTMIKSIVVTAALVAGVSMASAADTSSRAQDFAIQNKILQDESTSMPVGSPPVDRSAAPADPIPKASGLAQEEARFKVMDQELQQESTSMPAGSPQVNRNAVNQDPRPSAAEEERFLQENSTP